jgi:hypothetical protein
VLRVLNRFFHFTIENQNGLNNAMLTIFQIQHGQLSIYFNKFHLSSVAGYERTEEEKTDGG